MTQTEKERQFLYTRENANAGKNWKSFSVESKKSTLFCTCMKTIMILLISVPNAMVEQKQAEKRGSDGLIHRYYFSYFIHPELFSLRWKRLLLKARPMIKTLDAQMSILKNEMGRSTKTRGERAKSQKKGHRAVRLHNTNRARWHIEIEQSPP